MRFLTTIIGVIWHRASHKDAHWNSFVPEPVIRCGDERDPLPEPIHPRRARLCSSSVPLQPY
jgi:hypothetical protein